jgi:putative phosphoesterase
LWVLGDLINYGPNPAEVIEFVRANATYVVRGNHDHFIGYGEDPRCTARFREMALATGKYTDSLLSSEAKQYLRELPLEKEVQVGNTRFHLCHAIPSDPLYGYCPPESERWPEECQKAAADVLLVGHTHLQFEKKVGECLVTNPGSLGQTKTRSPMACFAVWEEGAITLQSRAYELERTIEKIQAMPLSTEVRTDLVATLRTGSVPEERKEKSYVQNRRG